MPLDSVAAADVAFLLSEFGEDWTHRPRGEESNDRAIRVICDEESPQQSLERGRSQSRSVKLGMDTSATISPRDLWIGRGKTWRTKSNSTLEGGMQTVWIERIDDEVTGKAQREIL